MARIGLTVLGFLIWPILAAAQIAPSETEIAHYVGLHRAAHLGDVRELRLLIAAGADLEARDGSGRTPVHVAAFASQDSALMQLAMAGADMNALEGRAYDAVTIAAVANDIGLLGSALKAGNRADLITSPYDGTALIAAAHLGHAQVVRMLLAAGAPPDHVNNLGWTALIEAVILGDGGFDHVATVRALLEGGADATIADRSGTTPLAHAHALGYKEIASVIAEAGG